MPFVSPGSSPPASTPWGLALAATSVLLAGGGALIWAHREPPEPDLVDSAVLAAPGLSRWPPPPIDDEAPAAPTVSTTLDGFATSRLGAAGLHSVAQAVEHGTRVVKIRVVPDGDELVIDAATGRLIETRPSRPTSPPPMGRFAAPFVPPT